MKRESMQRLAGGLALLLASAGACLPAPGAGRAPKRAGGVVTRLVQLGGQAHKPKAPVSIAVVPGAAAGANRQRVRVVVIPRVDAERVEVTTTASDGITIAQGRGRWSAAARRGRPEVDELIVAAAGPGERRLLVIATVVFRDGTRMPGLAVYALNPAGRRPGPLPPGAREVAHPEGGKVIEIPAEEPPDP